MIGKRIKDRVKKILRDQFGFFYPLGGQTVVAVKYALSHSNGCHYYEFGLYQGYTFCGAVKASPNIHHFGFDSFRGMPENSEGGGFNTGRFSVGYKKVLKNLIKNNAFSHKEHLVEGFFSDSLTPDLQDELRQYPAGVVLIDSDLYSSAVEVLNFIEPLVVDKTILIFDDWHSFDEGAGEKAAFKEFKEKVHNKMNFEEISECTARKMFRITLK